MRRAVGLNGRLEVELYVRQSGPEADGAANSIGEGSEIVLDGRTLKIERVGTGRKGLMTVHFEGVTDRDAAEVLRGLEIEVPESSLPPLPEGDFYHFQLIDCAVVDLEGRQIGTLSGIMETGSNDVYVVTTGDGDEVLIPATKDTVIEVDTVGKVVKVDPPASIASSKAPE